MYKNNNKSLDQYVLLYRTQQDEIITTLHSTIINITKQNSRKKILIVSHSSLYDYGKNLFLQYNFMKLIFLPDLLSNYHLLLERENKTHLIFPIENIIIISNSIACTICHSRDVHKIQSKVNGLVMGTHILMSRYCNNLYFEFVGTLRKWYRLVFIMNCLLVICWFYQMAF